MFVYRHPHHTKGCQGTAAVSNFTTKDKIRIVRFHTLPYLSLLKSKRPLADRPVCYIPSSAIPSWRAPRCARSRGYCSWRRAGCTRTSCSACTPSATSPTATMPSSPTTCQLTWGLRAANRTVPRSRWRRGMVKVPPWQPAPHSREEIGPLIGPCTRPLPRLLEPAASKAAHFTACDQPGAPPGPAAHEYIPSLRGMHAHTIVIAQALGGSSTARRTLYALGAAPGAAAQRAAVRHPAAARRRGLAHLA